MAGVTFASRHSEGSLSHVSAGVSAKPLLFKRPWSQLMTVGGQGRGSHCPRGRVDSCSVSTPGWPSGRRASFPRRGLSSGPRPFTEAAASSYNWSSACSYCAGVKLGGSFLGLVSCQ